MKIEINNSRTRLREGGRAAGYQTLMGMKTLQHE
jgi:hypothetical protein